VKSSGGTQAGVENVASGTPEGGVRPGVEGRPAGPRTPLLIVLAMAQFMVVLDSRVTVHLGSWPYARGVRESV
jgi:hypothetical protein